jgi:hypothetical protein
MNSDTTAWQRWHRDYDDPDSPLSRRLRVVQQRLREALDTCPSERIRLVSSCAGEGRDVAGVLAGHPRAADVTGRLVELDPVNVAAARASLSRAGADGCEVVEADAGTSDVYAGALPADVLLLCGIFGNVSDADVERTVRNARRLCAPGATVIWTRHRRPPDLTVDIRRWFAEERFDQVAFDAPDYAEFAVGTHRLVGAPAEFRPGVRLFTFR